MAPSQLRQEFFYHFKLQFYYIFLNFQTTLFLPFISLYIYKLNFYRKTRYYRGVPFQYYHPNISRRMSNENHWEVKIFIIRRGEAEKQTIFTLSSQEEIEFLYCNTYFFIADSERKPKNIN